MGAFKPLLHSPRIQQAKIPIPKTQPLQTGLVSWPKLEPKATRSIPIGSMYPIFTYIWLIFYGKWRVNIPYMDQRDKKVALSYVPPNLSPFSQNFWPLQNPSKAFSPPPESTNQPTAASVSSQIFGNKVSQAMNIETCVHSKFEWLTQNELFPQHDLLKRICFRVGWWKTSIIIREGQQLIISLIRSALIVENHVYSIIFGLAFLLA